VNTNLITISGELLGYDSVEFYDTQGVLQYSYEINHPTLDVSALSTGLYFLKFRAEQSEDVLTKLIIAE
jgi:hypothetical protein